jgi:hypothetical protein
MRAAGPLAAVALVVEARAEPIATLGRLMTEDPFLRGLEPVIAALKAGQPLPEALRRAGLLSRTQAKHLRDCPPEDLAESLGRLAQEAAIPSSGAALLRWFPLWALLVATVPSLVIGLIVALAGGGLFKGVLPTFEPNLRPPHPGEAWLLQAGVVAGFAALVAAVGALVPLLWGLWRFLPLDRPTARATALIDLLQRVRYGRSGGRAWHRWTWFSGLGTDARRALHQMAGDHRAAVLHLGLVPFAADGQPDWGAAIAEAEDARRSALSRMRPLALGVLICVGILGLMSWDSQSDLMMIIVWEFDAAIRVIQHTGVLLLLLVGGSTLLLWMISWLLRLTELLVVGAAADWPLVAERVARAIERREELTRTLRHLQAWTGWAMTRRLTAARLSEEPHPGRRLVEARVAPHSLGPVLATCPVEALPTVLRASVAERDALVTHGIGSQAMASFVTLVLLFGVLVPMAIHQRNELMFNGATELRWLTWMVMATTTVTVLFVAAFLLRGLARRWSWDLRWTGHRRLAEGLRLRQGLALGLPEADLGPGGDLPTILHRAGWSARTLQDLDRALARDLFARRVSAHRRTVILSLVLPVIVSIPIGLTGAAFMSLTTGVPLKSLGRGEPAPLGGGSLVMWTLQQQLDLAEQRARLMGAPETP